MFTDYENREQAHKEAKAKKEAKATEAFNEWLAKPETKFFLSNIPAAENPEAVQLILRSAFDAGSHVGAGEIAGMFLDALVKSPKHHQL